MNHLLESGKDLASCFPLKVTGSLLFLVAAHHALMFLCFSLLVLLDLLARWLAIAASLLRAEGDREPSLLAISYLAASEALSVIENLSEAGFTSMALLLKRLKGVGK